MAQVSSTHVDQAQPSATLFSIQLLTYVPTSWDTLFSLTQLSDKLEYCHGQDLKTGQSTRKPCKDGKGDFNTQTRSVSQPRPTAS